MAFDLLAPRAGEALLEIGFGGGALLESLAAARPRQLVAVDRSDDVVARGRSRMLNRAEVMKADASHLPSGERRATA